MSRLKSAIDLKRFRQEILTARNGTMVVSVTNGTNSRARGSQDVVRAFVEEIEKQGLAGRVTVKSTACHGFCDKEPIAVIFPEEICYVKVKPEDVSEIVSETFVRGKILERLLYEEPPTGQRILKEAEIPFYKYQNQVVLGSNRLLDMRSIDDYIAIGGYSALSRALFEMTPEQVIDEVKRANLRGRGGAGFSTGGKWEATRNAPGESKYVIVNCEEGDPGTYVDRSLMEGNPHGVLEGLIIGAYAIGSHKGFVHIRQEYLLALENVTTAIKQSEEYGLLGENILGSGFNFEVRVDRGAGVYVSGESTALMSAIEGRVGEPRPDYILPSEKGIWDNPSNVNNVKTLAAVPLIINRGADWFTSIGTEGGSKGTGIFSLGGNVNNTGLVEVPMGTTLRDIIYKIGGGIRGGKRFKAVQMGGPLGGCIPEQYLDTPVGFDELTRVGATMGSAMIVMDEDTCMVDVARYFLNFLADESCGKCVPCREGIRRMLQILNRICQGKGEAGDIGLLEELSDVLGDACLCELGRKAPTPLLSIIGYFREEYEVHIQQKRCPAGVCKALVLERS